MNRNLPEGKFPQQATAFDTNIDYIAIEMMCIHLFIATDVPMDSVVLTGFQVKVAIRSGAEAAAWQRNHQANESILQKIAVGALSGNRDAP